MTEQLSLHSQCNSTSLRTRGDGSYIDNIYFYFVAELSVLQMRKTVILWNTIAIPGLIVMQQEYSRV